MKRKLAQKDLSRVKEFLEQLDIGYERGTFDLSEGILESDEDLVETEETDDVEATSEEEIVTEIARHAQLPQPTVLRHIQNCRDFFETERGEIALSTYNIKLVKVLDQLFSDGLTIPQVIRELREGNTPVSFTETPQERRETAPFPFPRTSSPNAPVDYARKYFEAPRAIELSPEEEFDEMEEWEDEKRGWSIVKWTLLVLLPLVAVTILMGYHLGYLGSGRVEPETQDQLPPPAFLEEREQQTDEPDGTEEREITAENEEEAEEGEDFDEPALLPEEITIDVLNGCGVRGIAGRFAEKLREEGYNVMEVRDADVFTYTHSQIISRVENKEVQGIMEIFNQAELLSEEPQADEPMVTIIIGENDA